jgi:hypothetical protein
MSGLIASGPSKQYGSGGMVTRMSFAAIAMTASASNLDQLAFFGARVPRGPLGPPGGQVRLHRRPGPLQGTVGRGDAGTQRRGGLAGRPAEDVASDQRCALPRRQRLQGGQER